MRPVHKNPGNSGYKLPLTFSFLGKCVKSVKKVLNMPAATNVPVPVCLNGWHRYAVGDKSLPGTKAEQSEAVKAIQDKVANSYKCAAVPLTQELGPFCSFCETPLPGLLEVEHCVPKSEYPMFSLAWNNFLLACSPCNTAKGNVPSRSAVRAWAQSPITSENEFYAEVRLRHYVWADIGGQSHSWLPVQLEAYDAQMRAWNAVPMNQAAHLDNTVISHDISKREVKARIFDPASNSHLPRIVRSQVARPAGSNAGRAIEMVKLCDLNENGTLTSTYDRRVLNRTLAWFRCLVSLKTHLLQKNPAVQNSTWDMLLQNAAAVGFYSTWLTIVRSHNPKLAMRFVADTAQPLYYPGTDITNLP